MAEINIPKGKYCNGCEILSSFTLPDNSVVHHCPFGLKKCFSWYEMLALANNPKIEKTKVCIKKFGE